MSVTILEVLENAEYNLVKNASLPFAKKLGISQLHNAIVLLEKGYSIEDTFDMGDYAKVEDVPDKTER